MENSKPQSDESFLPTYSNCESKVDEIRKHSDFLPLPSNGQKHSHKRAFSFANPNYTESSLASVLRKSAKTSNRSTDNLINCTSKDESNKDYKSAIERSSFNVESSTASDSSRGSFSNADQENKHLFTICDMGSESYESSTKQIHKISGQSCVSSTSVVIHDINRECSIETSDDSRAVETQIQSKNESSACIKISSKSKEKSSNIIQSTANQIKHLIVPNYKYRNDEFRRLFKDVPDTENFILDYSCAYQKEILLHGRMYLSQNWLCFHANIFSWETTLTIPFQDINEITKERTAKVIPNAIQVITKSGKKYFFTSFVGRDKTHLVTFRLWQSSLLGHWENPACIWAWASHGYSPADLVDVNLKNVEEAYDDSSIITTASVDGKVDELVDGCAISGSLCPVARKLSNKKRRSSADVPTTLAQVTTTSKTLHLTPFLNQTAPIGCRIASAAFGTINHFDDDEFFDSTNENDDQEISCSCVTHDGKEMLNETYLISVDQLFILLFTDSSFFRRLQEQRNTTNLICGDWHFDKLRGVKLRELSYTVALNHALGPKSCEVVEKQFCAQCGRTGRVYVVKCEVHNSGVPYCESFYVVTTYCLTKITDGQCRLRLHGAVAYKKSCWSIVKSFIEKNALVGIQDYFSDLNLLLKRECEQLGFKSESIAENDEAIEMAPSISSKKRLSSECRSVLPEKVPIVYPLIPAEIERVVMIVLALLILILIVNCALFYKIWSIKIQYKEQAFVETIQNLRTLLETPDFDVSTFVEQIEQQQSILKWKKEKWKKVIGETEHSLLKIEELLISVKQKLLESVNNKADQNS